MGAEEKSLRPLIYFDTNILSYLARGEEVDFPSTIRPDGSQAITSNLVLHEMGRSSKCLTAQERDLLDRLPLFWIDIQTPIAKGQIPELWPKPPEYVDESHIENLQLWLLRFAIQSKSIIHASQEMAAHIRLMLNEAVKEVLADQSAPFLMKLAILDQWAELEEKLEVIEKAETPQITRKDMAAEKLGPDYIGHFKPPNILRRIVANSPEPEAFLKLSSEQDNGDPRNEIRYMANILLIFGFARDRDLGKQDLIKSTGGARSQLYDIEHIAHASFADTFVTADYRAAKLAYAVYEYLQIKTQVVLAQPHKKPILLSPEAWPS